MWKHIGQEVKHALIGTEALKNLNALLCVDLLVVLDGNLCNDLHILPVGLEHVVHALKAIFLAQPVEELDDLLLWDGVGVQHHSLDILHI